MNHRRAIRSMITDQKPKAKLIRVVSITAGGNHAWVESDQGSIRKPLSAIPKDLLDAFRNRREG